MITSAIRITKIISELSKFKITFFVTLTTVFGFICNSRAITAEAFVSAVGIFLLASGSAVINHLQETRTDALMQRTRRRPLITGSFSRNKAIWLVIFYFSAAIALMLFFGLGTALGVGMVTVIFYNGIYTPLKRKSFAAIIPGAVIGALPPVAGWAAAGGSLIDPQILVVAFFFFIWQIPHFWLLLLFFRQDYENAGFPTMFRHFSQSQVARITYIWTAATGACGMIFPLFSLLKTSLFVFLAAALFVWLLYKSSVLLKPEIERDSFKSIFKEINVYVLGVVLLVSLDKLLIFF